MKELNYISELEEERIDARASLLIIVALFLISPFFAFLFSLFCFRQKGSLFMLVLFSFYFGWFYEPQMDLLNHYNNFRKIIHKPLGDMFTDPETLFLGKEPYHILFKYFIGKISDSSNLFSAVACAAYSALFAYGVLGSVRDLYKRSMPLVAWTAFFGIIFTVEYFWFLGLRFWTGAFIFLAFYIRYIRSMKKRYFYLSFLCILFHYTLISICIAAVINEVLKQNFKLRYILLFVAWVVHYLEIAVIVAISKLSIFSGIIDEKSTSDKMIASFAKRAAYFRNEGNLFYQIRNDVLFWGAAISLFFLWKQYDKSFDKIHTKLWGLFLIIYSFANFGYTSLIFYDRFYKMAILLFYIFLFIQLMEFRENIKEKPQLGWFLLTLVPILYGVATTIVPQRAHLFDFQLWFSNFFTIL